MWLKKRYKNLYIKMTVLEAEVTGLHLVVNSLKRNQARQQTHIDTLLYNSESTKKIQSNTTE